MVICACIGVDLIGLLLLGLWWLFWYGSLFVIWCCALLFAVCIVVFVVGICGLDVLFVRNYFSCLVCLLYLLLSLLMIVIVLVYFNVLIGLFDVDCCFVWWFVYCVYLDLSTLLGCVFV